LLKHWVQPLKDEAGTPSSTPDRQNGQSPSSVSLHPDGQHLSPVVHAVTALVGAPQIPPWHVVPAVHPWPSSQARPSLAGVTTQVRASSSQLLTVHASSVAPHRFGALTQAPPLHASPTVQNLESSHGVPSGARTDSTTHCPARQTFAPQVFPRSQASSSLMGAEAQPASGSQVPTAHSESSALQSRGVP
jgi:hypothetical protein